MRSGVTEGGAAFASVETVVAMLDLACRGIGWGKPCRKHNRADIPGRVNFLPQLFTTEAVLQPSHTALRPRAVPSWRASRPAYVPRESTPAQAAAVRPS